MSRIVGLFSLTIFVHDQSSPTRGCPPALRPDLNGPSTGMPATNKNQAARAARAPHCSKNNGAVRIPTALFESEGLCFSDHRREDEPANNTEFVGVRRETDLLSKSVRIDPSTGPADLSWHLPRTTVDVYDVGATHAGVHTT